MPIVEPSYPGLLTAQEVATMMQMPLSTIYDLARKDKLPFPKLKIGSSVRFRRSEVELFLQGASA